ncbi:MAG: membrane protein insertase YidC, partial [Wohlfahrtiimonas sp.]
MQNNRLILWAIFGLLAFMVFNKWQTANLPVAPQTVETAQVSTTSSTANSLLPTIGTADVSNGVALTQIDSTKTITVTTDVLSVELSPVGGDIVSVKLLKYSESLEEKDKPFELLSSSDNRLFVSRTGLSGPKDSAQASFTDKAGPFIAAQASYQLVDGEETLIVPLTYTDPETGSVLTKTYTFTKGHYDVGFEQKITNNSAMPWVGGSYVSLAQKDPKISGHMVGASSYAGPVFSMGEEAYTKVPFDKTTKEGIVVNGTRGWGAMIQQYFTSAWLALDDRATGVKVAKDDNNESVVLLYDAQGVTVQPGTTHSFNNNLYIGPKIKKDLVAAGEYKAADGKDGNAKLELTLDYGWFSPISALMLIVLEFFHGFVGNYGWSIVLLTFTVKLVLYPFSEKGYRSMAKMRHLAPEMQRLKELYGSDKQKIGQETIALYRKEKVNPMGGCWPMLIQIPIFI